jgi:hypothetical protein
MPHTQRCEELNRIKLQAIAALHTARLTRRSRDLSFQEDVELTRDEHQKIDALLKHLLAGHNGHPCPAGDRPIVGIARPLNATFQTASEAPGQTASEARGQTAGETRHPIRAFALSQRRP